MKAIQLFSRLLVWGLSALILFCIFIFFFSKTDAFFYLSEKIIFGHIYLTPTQAEKKWGQLPFDVTQFRAKKGRKEMAADIVKTKRLLGLTRGEVVELLGKRDGGYYITESILTYSLFVARNPNGDVTEAYSLLLLTSDVSDPQSRVDRIYIWKDW